MSKGNSYNTIKNKYNINSKYEPIKSLTSGKFNKFIKKGSKRNG